MRGLVILPFFWRQTRVRFSRRQFFHRRVTGLTNRTLLKHGGEWTLLTNEMTMTGGITVFTNGTFQIKEGKARSLEAGQILRADGILLNPDGSVMPAFDHIAMIKGTVMVFKNGKGEAMTAPLTLLMAP